MTFIERFPLIAIAIVCALLVFGAVAVEVASLHSQGYSTILDGSQ
jgi:hypothetical protein